MISRVVPITAEQFRNQLAKTPDMNQPLPDVVLPSVANGWVDMSSYRGKAVLIVFWTTWCPGCVEEVPDLIQLQNEFGDKGFKVVAVAVDDQGEESVESFVKRHFQVSGAAASINYPVLLGDPEIAAKLGFEGGLPASVLVNRDGTGVKIIRGSVRESAISKFIRNLIRN